MCEYMALLELVVFSMSICYLKLLHIPQSVFSLAVSFQVRTVHPNKASAERDQGSESCRAV